jgi:hypothetical protein
VGGLLKEAVCIVDWYHALEHVWACGRVLHGEESDETKAWVKELEALLWEGQAPHDPGAAARPTIAHASAG